MCSLLRRHSMIGGAAGVSSTLLNGLVASWGFDESSGNAIDRVGGNDGTVVGATQGAAGKVGTAYIFDGIDDFVNIDTAVNDLSSTTIGTWAGWVKPVDATPTDAERIISFADKDANEVIHILFLTTGQLRGQTNVGGATRWILQTDSAPFSDNTWTHVAIVQDGTEPVLYVDGVAVAQTFTTSTDKTAWFSDAAGIDNGRIGDTNFNNNGEARHFNGSIDEVHIWNRALTADEITELFTKENAGNGYPWAA